MTYCRNIEKNFHVWKIFNDVLQDFFFLKGYNDRVKLCVYVVAS